MIKFYVTFESKYTGDDITVWVEAPTAEDAVAVVENTFNDVGFIINVT